MAGIFEPKNLGRTTVAALAASAGIVTADGVRYYHVSPQQLCGIPPADYQPPQPPPAVVPVIALSSKGQVLAQPVTPPPAARPMSLQIPGTTAAPATRVKSYQFSQSTLAVDHCSISRMALTIQDNGLWRLSLQADQNPQVETSTALTTVQPATTPIFGGLVAGRPASTTAPMRGLPAVQLKHTSFLKRNQFVIRLRGLGNFSEVVAVPATPAAIGKAVLFAPPPIIFWVQNGVPYALVHDGYDRDVQQFFDMIDRVEIELSYR
jgi:hypothetical protein